MSKTPEITQADEVLTKLRQIRHHLEETKAVIDHMTVRYMELGFVREVSYLLGDIELIANSTGNDLLDQIGKILLVKVAE